ncbi:unnamed protein product [Owenia fusiformis]|uniref:Calcineurin-binding protein cabin-1 n=1 Tax=Owenia fusiformis TaxID=6347 RepID=A0A8S4NSY8_OWEFU|nr:unnamed protein product [Owenia fusiformis]
MIRISALNESNNSFYDDSNDAPATVTKEAEESESFALYNKALSLQRQNQHVAAKATLLKLLESPFVKGLEVDSDDEDEPLVLPGLVLKYSAYKNLGSLASLEGDYTTAVEAYLQAVQLDATDVTVWYKLGSLAIKLRHLTLARHSLIQGLECSANHWPCLDQLILVLYVLSNYENCLFHISMALKRDPGYLRGLVLMRKILCEHPSLKEFTKHYFTACDPSIYTIDIEKEEEDEFVNEALELRNERQKLCQPKPLPVLKFPKPLTALSWLSLGEALIALYEDIEAKPQPISIGCRIDLSMYNTENPILAAPIPSTENVPKPPPAISVTDSPPRIQRFFDPGINPAEPSESENSAKENSTRDDDSSLLAGHKQGKKRKRLMNLFDDPAGKRRSARVRNTNRKQQEERVNFQELLQKFLPSSLMDVKETDADDVVKEASVKQSQKAEIDKEILESDDISVFCENEASEVHGFLKSKQTNGGIIDLMDRFLISLVDKSNTKWPPGLADVFVRVFHKLRNHFEFPSFFSVDVSRTRREKLGMVCLVYLELRLDHWFTKKATLGISPKKSAGMSIQSQLGQDFPGKYFEKDVCYILALCQVSDLYEENWRHIYTRASWLKARYCCLLQDTKEAVKYFNQTNSLLEELSDLQNVNPTEDKSGVGETACSNEAKPDMTPESMETDQPTEDMKPVAKQLPTDQTMDVESDDDKADVNDTNAKITEPVVTIVGDILESIITKTITNSEGLSGSVEVPMNISPEVAEHITPQNDIIESGGNVDLEMSEPSSHTDVLSNISPTTVPSTTLSHLVPSTTQISNEAQTEKEVSSMVPLTSAPSSMVLSTTVPSSAVPVSTAISISNVETLSMLSSPTVQWSVIVSAKDASLTTEPSNMLPSSTMSSSVTPSTSVHSSVVPSTKLPSTGVLSTTMPSTATMPSTCVPSISMTSSVPPPAIPSTDVPSQTITSSVVPLTMISSSEVPPTTMPSSGVSLTTLSSIVVPSTTIPSTIIPSTTAPSTVEALSTVPSTEPSTEIPSTVVSSRVSKTSLPTTISLFPLLNQSLNAKANQEKSLKNGKSEVTTREDNAKNGTDEARNAENKPECDKNKIDSDTNEVAKSDGKIRIHLVNCQLENIISTDEVNKQLEALLRCQSLEEMTRLSESNKHEMVVELLLQTFKQPQSAKNKATEVAGVPERHAQLLLLQDSLSQLGDAGRCLLWSEVALNEALQHYQSSNTSAGKDEWATTMCDLLKGIDKCMQKDPGAIQRLTVNKAAKLAHNLIRIIEICMELPDAIEEMPIDSVMPWIILYRLIKHEEAKLLGSGGDAAMVMDENNSNDSIGECMSSSLLLLNVAHDYLGRRSWCTNSQGALLEFYLDVVWEEFSKYNSDTSHPHHEDLESAFEQCVYCLYGHPNRKSRARHLYDHNAQQIDLTLERSKMLFEYFKPKSLPEFDSLKVSTVSSELEHLLQRICILLPPQSQYTSISIEMMTSYIDGSVSTFPIMQHPPADDLAIVQEMFYFLADYYFKNKETAKAIKYYLRDLCVCPDRIDSWAGMALSRTSKIEEKLNATDMKKNEGSVAKLSQAALTCFLRATELDENNSKLWIEYGSLAFQLHSHASRQLKQGNKDDETLLKMKNDMLQLAEKCYLATSKCDSEDAEEEWLHSYMLGKISEKMNRPPEIYLEYYKKAAEDLYEDNAQYPKKITYLYSPPRLAVEALEMFFRLHISVLKYALKLRQGVDFDKQGINYEMLVKYLTEARDSPFALAREKKKEKRDSQRDTSSADENSQTSQGSNQELIPRSKSRPTYHQTPQDHDYSKSKTPGSSSDASGENRHAKSDSDDVFSPMRPTPNLVNMEIEISAFSNSKETVIEEPQVDSDTVHQTDNDSSTADDRAKDAKKVSQDVKDILEDVITKVETSDKASCELKYKQPADFDDIKVIEKKLNEMVEDVENKQLEDTQDDKEKDKPSKVQVETSKQSVEHELNTIDTTEPVRCDEEPQHDDSKLDANVLSDSILETTSKTVALKADSPMEGIDVKVEQMETPMEVDTAETKGEIKMVDDIKDSPKVKDIIDDLPGSIGIPSPDTPFFDALDVPPTLEREISREGKSGDNILPPSLEKKPEDIVDLVVKEEKDNVKNELGDSMMSKSAFPPSTENKVKDEVDENVKGQDIVEPDIAQMICRNEIGEEGNKDISEQQILNTPNPISLIQSESDQPPTKIRKLDDESEIESQNIERLVQETDVSNKVHTKKDNTEEIKDISKLAVEFNEKAVSDKPAVHCPELDVSDPLKALENLEAVAAQVAAEIETSKFDDKSYDVKQLEADDHIDKKADENSDIGEKSQNKADDVPFGVKESLTSPNDRVEVEKPKSDENKPTYSCDKSTIVDNTQNTDDNPISGDEKGSKPVASDETQSYKGISEEMVLDPRTGEMVPVSQLNEPVDIKVPDDPKTSQSQPLKSQTDQSQPPQTVESNSNEPMDLSTTSSTTNQSKPTTQSNPPKIDQSKPLVKQLGSDWLKAVEEVKKKPRCVPLMDDWLPEKVLPLAKMTMRALELCLTRFPQHYKSLYWLAYMYYATKDFKNLGYARDLLMGTKVPWQTLDHMPCASLLHDRKQNNFFNGIWRIPIEEVDRPGSFPSHLNRCIVLLLDVLRDIHDSRGLYSVHCGLNRVPDSQRKYLRDADRLHLAKMAFSCTKDAILLQLPNMAKEKDNERIQKFILEAYKVWQHSSKQSIVRESKQEMNSMLVHVYSACRSKQLEEQPSILEQATRYCIQHSHTKTPQTPTHSSGPNSTPSTPGSVTSPRPQATTLGQQKLVASPKAGGSKGVGVNKQYPSLGINPQIRETYRQVIKSSISNLTTKSPPKAKDGTSVKDAPEVKDKKGAEQTTGTPEIIDLTYDSSTPSPKAGISKKIPTPSRLMQLKKTSQMHGTLSWKQAMKYRASSHNKIQGPSVLKNTTSAGHKYKIIRGLKSVHPQKAQSVNPGVSTSSVTGKTKPAYNAGPSVDVKQLFGSPKVDLGAPIPSGAKSVKLDKFFVKDGTTMSQRSLDIIPFKKIAKSAESAVKSPTFSSQTNRPQIKPTTVTSSHKSNIKSPTFPGVKPHIKSGQVSKPPQGNVKSPIFQSQYVRPNSATTVKSPIFPGQPKPQMKPKSTDGSIVGRSSTIGTHKPNVSPQSGTMKPQSGTMRPQGGTVKPQCGTMKPQSGTMKPQSGNIKSQGGTVRPQSGTMKPQSGTMKSHSGTLKPQGGSSNPITSPQPLYIGPVPSKSSAPITKDLPEFARNLPAFKPKIHQEKPNLPSPNAPHKNSHQSVTQTSKLQKATTTKTSGQSATTTKISGQSATTTKTSGQSATTTKTSGQSKPEGFSILVQAKSPDIILLDSD